MGTTVMVKKNNNYSSEKKSFHCNEKMQSRKFRGHILKSNESE